MWLPSGESTLSPTSIAAFRHGTSSPEYKQALVDAQYSGSSMYYKIYSLHTHMAAEDIEAIDAAIRQQAFIASTDTTAPPPRPTSCFFVEEGAKIDLDWNLDPQSDYKRLATQGVVFVENPKLIEKSRLELWNSLLDPVFGSEYPVGIHGGMTVLELYPRNMLHEKALEQSNLKHASSKLYLMALREEAMEWANSQTKILQEDVFKGLGFDPSSGRGVVALNILQVRFFHFFVVS
jgi:hypothetical protein